MSKNEIESIYPLAPVQQGMLFAALARPDLFIEQVEFGLIGAVDEQLLEAAWQQVVARHPMLRTGFVWKDQNKPVQFVLKHVQAPFQFRDLSQAADCDAAVSACRSDAQRQGFKLSQAPLTRLLLIRLSPTSHRIVWTVHHILIDGWCNSILIGDLLACYAALKSGQAWTPAPARPYRDYVQWLSKRDRSHGERFWRSYLQGVAQATVPGAISEQPTQASGHLVAVRELPAPIAGGLATALRERQLTWASFCHALWSIVLAWSADTDVVVFGSTLGARPEALTGIERTIGPFISSLPVLARLSPSVSWSELLIQMQSDLLAIRGHGDWATAEVHAWSGIPANAPLFQSLLVFENYPMPVAESGGDTDIPVLETLDGDGARTPYPLTVLIAAADHGLKIKLIGNCTHLDGVAVNTLLDAMCLLLETAARDIADTKTVAHALARLTPLGRPRFHRLQDEANVAADADPDARCRSASEHKIAAVWAKVFGRTTIPAHRDFFALGGHSLLATELLNAMRAELGLSVSLSELFAHASVRALATHVADRFNEDAAAAAPLVVLKHDAAGRHLPFPLTDIQQAYWIGRSDAVSMGNVATHSYSELDVADQDPNFKRFETTLAALIARHDMLRAVFDNEGEQRVLATTPHYFVKVHDWRSASDAETQAGIEAIRTRMSHEVLPADRWPLFAVEISWLAERRFRIHLSVDMLIVDGGSQQLLIRDFIGMYLGQEAELPKLDITFRDYVVALRQLRAGTEFARARDYWVERVPKLPPAPELPLAVDPDGLKAPRFARRQRHFDAGLWQRLGERAVLGNQ